MRSDNFLDSDEQQVMYLSIREMHCRQKSQALLSSVHLRLDLGGLSSLRSALWPWPFASSCWKGYQFSFAYFVCWTLDCQFSLHKSPKKLLDGNISHHWLSSLSAIHTFKSTFLLILWISGTVTNLSLVLTDSYRSHHPFSKIMTNKAKRLPEGLGNDDVLLNTILELLSAFFSF